MRILGLRVRKKLLCDEDGGAWREVCDNSASSESIVQAVRERDLSIVPLECSQDKSVDIYRT